MDIIKESCVKKTILRENSTIYYGKWQKSVLDYKLKKDNNSVIQLASKNRPMIIYGFGAMFDKGKIVISFEQISITEYRMTINYTSVDCN